MEAKPRASGPVGKSTARGQPYPSTLVEAGVANFPFYTWCGIPEGCPCLKSVEMLELNLEKLLQRAVALEKKAGGPQRQGDSLAVFHS